MPRAVIPERQRQRQIAAQVAVAQREAQSAEAAIVERVEEVGSGVPPDLEAQLADIRARLDAVEP